MAIIAYLGSTVNDYIEKSIKLLSELTIYCPEHNTVEMAAHGSYERGIKETGEKIRIYRFICYECGATVAVLPDFLLPYKQYSANEIEAVLIDAESTKVYDIETQASVYTVRRWIKEMGPLIIRWISMLKALALEITGKAVSEISLFALAPIEQLRTLAECLPKIKTCGNMLGFAAVYLSSHFHVFP